VDFYGNFYMANTTDVELAAVGTDTALAVEIKHDDKLSEAEGAYVQAAVLYTSVGGRRRLRVLNSAFNCCTQVTVQPITRLPRLLESPGFFLENSRTWKVLENHFGPGKSWKLKLEVLKSPGKISLNVVHFASGSNGKQAAIV